jgi:hypothetical protein
MLAAPQREAPGEESPAPEPFKAALQAFYASPASIFWALSIFHRTNTCVNIVPFRINRLAQTLPSGYLYQE